MPAAMPAKDNGMYEAHEVQADMPKDEHQEHAKLILSFDGTGNQYSGDTSDTNIVKLFQKFNRKTPNQYHYYQPGIGTYTMDASSLNLGLWGSLKRAWSETLDEGLGTTFDQHVIAGYRFAMRYYNDGDKIFMFGFSRGAFTARFLARMIATVGLLSKGNEEMVPFAYRTYQEYEMGSGSKFKTAGEAEEYMNSFKTTFCRIDTKIHFLGLFDTVNSVGYFENPFARKKYLPSVLGTASHIRHAVAIDERRCKFKAALLQQDQNNPDEDIKEVFFPGGHGDVGGGWPAKGGKAKVEADDALQLSDLTLEWMISELDALPPSDQVAWNEHRDIFLRNFRGKVSIDEAAVRAHLHDILAYGNCVSRMKTFLWHIMEWLPIFTRLELIRGQWKPITFPPNMCQTRDIPEGANFHPSVKERMLRVKSYRPTNDGILKVQTV